jgi:hypothetical protein
MDEQKKEIAKEAMKALSEIEQTVRMEDLVKNNMIEWKHDDKLYRVRKPSFVERQEIDNARRKRYLEMINDDSYFFKKQWVDKYKAKGINIAEKEAKVRSLQEDIKSLLLRLATAETTKDIESLKKEIYKLRDTQLGISMEVTDLLSYSIEDQLTIYVNSYTTYIVMEVKDGEDWKRVYDSYDAFKKSEAKVINEAFYYISYLIYQYTEEEKK